MGQLDHDKDVSADTREQEQDAIGNERLVPVTESIRYRKRAQSAEHQVQGLAGKLTEAETNISEMSEQLNEVRLENQLIHKLGAAGAVDIETALLVAKGRMKGGEQVQVDEVIEQMRNEKSYLFDQPSPAAVVKRTAGAREKTDGHHTGLARAAKRAANSGDRTDLQEYLKLRRGLL